MVPGDGVAPPESMTADLQSAPLLSTVYPGMLVFIGPFKYNCGDDKSKNHDTTNAYIYSSFSQIHHLLNNWVFPRSNGYYPNAGLISGAQPTEHLRSLF